MRSLVLTLLLIPTLFLSNGYTQDDTTWGLPEGAKRHTGKGNISFLKFSSDGNRLAVATMIGIWRYDVHAGAELALFTGHTEGVKNLAFSPDGSMLASTSNDLTIRLWNVDTRAHLSTLTGHKRPVEMLVYSPDGTILASSSQGSTIRLWNPETGKHLRSLAQFGLTDTNQQFPTLTRQTSWIEALAFSPDASTLASGDHEGTVQLWNVDNGRLLSTLKEHTEPIRALAFSRNGAILMSVDWEGTLHSWDAATRDYLSTLTLNGNEYWGLDFEFSADGTTLVSGVWAGKGKTILFWDINIGRASAPLMRHMIFASGGVDSTILLWDWEKIVRSTDR